MCLRSFPMMRAEELAARAEQLGKLADKAIDLSYAKVLRQRARQWRDTLRLRSAFWSATPCTVAYTIAPTPSRKGASALN